MRNKKRKTIKRKTFKEAVESTPDVCNCYMVGKQAIISSDRNKCELTVQSKCGGSLFIDECLKQQNKYPQDNRWDYAIDYNSEVFFFEVHTANTSQVSTVLKKLQWLKDWLIRKAPEINSIKASAPYYWVHTNGYHILPNSSQERSVIQKGLKPVSKLLLR
jgi:NAD(P)H-nitrite reductase large subunit